MWTRFRRELLKSADLRVLYVAPRECWPATSGARVRDYNLASQLARRSELTCLAFSTDPAQKDVLRSNVGADSEIRQILVPRPKGYSPGTVLKGLAGPIPVTVLNYTTRFDGERTRADS